MLPVSKTYFQSQTLPHDFGPFPVLHGGHECEGPKLSFKFPRPAAPVLYKLLLSHRGGGGGVQNTNSPQESKSSVSICANIGNMSILFQIVCDIVTPRYFMLSTFSSTVLSRM